jgi:RHS repeat-associated protein
VSKISDVAYTVPEENRFISRLGMKRYELVNHLGNVQAVISDRALPVKNGNMVSHYQADLLSATDYYPFGMVMAGRSLNTDDYRYGFNGKEFDQDWDGGEAMYDFGARIYDPRIPRWASVDPLSQKMPGISPYVAMDNSPLAKIDPDGKLPVFLALASRAAQNFAIGAGIDYAAQVGVNLATTDWNQGTTMQNLKTAFYGGVDFTDVGASGAAAVFMPGPAALRSMSRLGKVGTGSLIVGLELGKASIDLTPNNFADAKKDGNFFPEFNSREKTATVAGLNLIGGVVLGEIVPGTVAANTQKKSYELYNKGYIAESYQMRGQIKKVQSTGETTGAYTSNSIGNYAGSKFPPVSKHQEPNVAQQDATRVQSPPKTFKKP